MASLLLPVIYLAFISLGLPDSLLGAHYFDYGTSKTEQSFRAYWDKIKHKPGGKAV